MLNKQERFIVKLAVSCYVLSIFFAIVSNRAYYADGVNFLFKMINSKMSSALPFALNIRHLRFGCDYLIQFPTALAIHFGLSVKIISLVYGFSHYISALIGFGVCCYLSRENKTRLLFPLICYVVFCINSMIFIQNEAFVALWIYWCMYFIITRNQYSILDFIIGAVVFIIFPISHETVIFVSLVFCFVIIHETRKTDSKLRKYMLFALLIYVITSACVVFINLINNDAPTKVSYATEILFILRPALFLRSSLFLAVVGSLFILYLYLSKNAIRFHIFNICFVSLGLVYIILNYFSKYPHPELGFESRAYITAGVFISLCLIFLYDIGLLKLDKIKLKSIFVVTMELLLLQSIWQIQVTEGWHKYYSNFRDYVLSSEGIVENIYESDPYAAWEWTAPATSLLINEDINNIKTIVLPDKEHEFLFNDKGLWIPFSKVDQRVFNYNNLYNSR